MSEKWVIKGATIVNEGKSFVGDVYLNNRIIERIEEKVGSRPVSDGYKVINAEGLYLFPGVIDDQVHFREPGLEYKAEIYTESKAAVAGGVTSFMEMPNTNPPALTQELLEDKYELAKEKSLANFSFYMGASNYNLDEVLKTDPAKVCGLKVFMGSSTGDMLVDDEMVLEQIFSKVHMLIATHCEDEQTVRSNNEAFYKKFGLEGTAVLHPQIRTAEACYLSSSKAVRLARKYGARLHVLHLSTAQEMELFDDNIPLTEKKITAEVCVHHLWFSDEDYEQKGNFIKWNPAIKAKSDRESLWASLLSGKLDVIATDHAPHTLEEKERPYFKAPSGGPLVQHSLVIMMEFVRQGKLSMEQVVEKMCHNPAILFDVKKRGFIREGYFADLVLVDVNRPWKVKKDNLYYKCGWSPFEGTVFNSQVLKTFVNGSLVYDKGKFYEDVKGERLEFNR
ncbi:MAG: dihydroorotase [Bacteroidales bacterium]|nr:dihydroorotase [Bacteroidales bacterium]